MVSKTQEFINDIMMEYGDDLEDCYPDYDIDEMFPEHEYGYIDIIN